MARAKVTFIPSDSSAAVAYKLYYGSSQYALTSFFDLDCSLVDGLMEAIVEGVVLDAQTYAVKAVNSVGEESDVSNLVVFDPRIDAPDALVIENA